MRKIRNKRASQDKLVELCEKETGNVCSYPSWKIYNDLDTIIPPRDTVAILIKVHETLGVVYIHVNETDEYKDRVGKDYKGYTVILPWKSELKFICYGQCEVGIVAPSRVEEAERGTKTK